MTIYDHVLTEGGFVDQNDLRYPFEERGLQFGDGIYEVIRVYNGISYLIQEHVERLYRSAAAVKINVPFSKEDMYHKMEELLHKNGIDGDAKIYLQITRGSAPRDHVFPLNTNANLYAYVKDLPRPEALLREGVSAVTQEDVRWDWCYIKSLNLLPNVLAKQAAKEQNCYEAILHKQGEVTECSSSNIYLVKDGSVYTHPAKKNILHGCVRMRVEAFCSEEGVSFIEQAFQVEDIWNADEVFLSSSTSEVMPVIQVDGKQVGNGVPGTVTRTLQKKYEEDAKLSADASLFSSEVAAE
ncbi:D-amino-acid transaminase [Halobacillus sp. ACCC02827]|uniref:D-amino-acid transaminase n=1 Tax=Halobacillus sp. ACCC02827 TaxID=3052090 RepID=UPI0025702257|nr:D-amino-acid transaminase [Halobacillus sp. ACCC02827]WJE16729.1 D-amino-acid transaminase [Halobacillus sp. ACCC02827]